MATRLFVVRERTQMRAMVGITSRLSWRLAGKCHATWSAFKPVVKCVAEAGSATTGKLLEVVGLGESLSRHVDVARHLFSTKVVTTTKIPVNLMVPFLFSGRWTPGPAMKGLQ